MKALQKWIAGLMTFLLFVGVIPTNDLVYAGDLVIDDSGGATFVTVDKDIGTDISFTDVFFDDSGGTDLRVSITDEEETLGVSDISSRETDIVKGTYVDDGGDGSGLVNGPYYEYEETITCLFTFNGFTAFCANHSALTPTGDMITSSSFYKNENILRALYYGYDGAEQWSGFTSTEQAVVLTHLAISHYFSNEPTREELSNGYYDTRLGLKSFIEFLESQEAPNSEISFTPSEVTASLNADGTQQTGWITFNGWSKNSVTLNLPDGVTLIDSEGNNKTGNVTIAGGTKFYLKGKKGITADIFEVEEVKGSMPEYNAIVLRTGVEGYQSVMVNHDEGYSDPIHKASLSVDWVNTSLVELIKTDSDGELVNGAVFNVSCSDLGYSKDVSITDGKVTLNNLLPGTYTVKETVAPHGYLLNTTPKTFTVAAGDSASVTIVNSEPVGKITLTKVDRDTDSPQGLGTLKGAKYGLYAAENITDGNGSAIYSKDTKVAEGTTDDTGQIVWESLPLGKYYIKELSASTGYLVDSSKYYVTLSYKDSKTEVVEATVEVYESAVTGIITATKKDGKTGQVVSAKQTGFTLYAAEDMNIGGTVYKKGTAIKTLSTTSGVATFTGLPYGKYYVQETAPPSGYMDNGNVSGTIAVTENGKTYTYTAFNTPVTGVINLQKLDKELGKAISQGLATIKDAEYTLYAAEDIKNPATGETLWSKGSAINVKTVGSSTWGDTGAKKTGADGTISWSNLPLGKYMVKETQASTGYLIDGSEYVVTLAFKDNKTSIIYGSVTSQEQVVKGLVTATKKDGKTGQVVSAKQTGFTLYAAEDMNVGGTVYTKGTAIKTLSTTSGVATFTGLPYGKYYVQETAPPNGYMDNGNVSGTIAVTENGKNYTYTANNTPVTGIINLQKLDKELGKAISQGLSTLKDAEYTLYAAENILNPATGETLWSKGSVISVKTVGSSTWGDTGAKKTGADGTISWSNLPLGKYMVKETKASTGYLIDGSEYTVTLAFKDNKTSTIYGSVTSQEQVIKGLVTATKKDGKTGQVVSAKQTGFTLYAAEDMNIGGTVYKKGTAIKTLSTTSGVATFTGLPYGKYYVQETAPPNGYMDNGNVSGTIAVTENGKNYTYTANNTPVTGIINLQKLDKELGKAISQGLATLKDAEYTLYAAEDIKIPATGETLWSKGSVISVKTVGSSTWGDTGAKKTGADGTISWTNLPLGKYMVKETKASTGYLLDESEYTVTLAFKDNKTSIIYGSVTSQEQIIRADIELAKFGANSNDTEATAKEPLEGVIFEVKSTTTGKCFYLKTNENGFADSEKNIYTNIIINSDGSIEVDEASEYKTPDKGAFVYDNYTIRELNTPTGYMPIRDINFNLFVEGYKYQWILEDKDILSAVQIVKIDAETGHYIPLVGTSFRLYDENMQPITMIESYYPSIKYVDLFVTDENGSFIFPEKLKVGKYYLEEVEAPDGYLLGEVLSFEVVEGRDWSTPLTIKFADENVMGHIEITKTDSLSGEYVEGAVYGIYAANDIITNDGTVRYAKGELVDRLVTDANGYAISRAIYLGQYLVQEIESPVGYKLDENIYAIELLYKDGLTPLIYVSQKVQDDPNTIYIIKKDLESGEVLKGAILQLIDEDGNIVDEWMSDEAAHMITKLPAGIYTIHEEKAPEGYVTAEDIIVEISGGINEAPYEVLDTPIKVLVDKINGKTLESIKGAKLELIDEDGNVIDEWVSDGQPHLIYAIPSGTYILHEAVTPEGYVTAEDMLIDVKEVSKVQEYVMIDEPIVIEIDKVSSLTGGSLPGATLQLLDEEGNVAYEWVSDGHPHRIELIRYGTYTLHEAVTPEGYVTAEDMLIDVQEIQDLQEYVMVDEPIIIEIDKVSSLTGGSLPGATLQLLDEDGKVAYEWVSDGHPHRIELIKYGTYILHEAVTPEGYVTAEDMLIDVKEVSEVQEYVMVDEPIIIEIDKIANDTNMSLPEATLQLIDEDGNVVYEWVTDGKSHVIYAIPSGIYTLHEVKSPDKYVLAKDIVVDVKETPEIQKFKMVDMRIGRILTVLISPDVIPVGTPSTNTIGSPSPGTGDETNITYLSLLLFSAITAVSSVKKGSKRKVN